MVGGSSGEDESSLEDRVNAQSHQSSLTAGLKKPAGSKKQLSFRDIVASHRMGNKSHEDVDVFESGSEDDVSDNAIDDSDDDVDEKEEEEDDWEDDASENAENNDKPTFQRIDSKPNLVSRRSLLTSMMNQEDRASAFQDMAMKSAAGLKKSKTSSNIPAQDESNVTTATSEGGFGTPSRPILRTKSEIISLVSSPKTTRRNMLSTEINEELRKSILHERLQKKSTINAYNKRVQSTSNMSSLREESRETRREEYNYYTQGIGNYHQAGW